MNQTNPHNKDKISAAILAGGENLRFNGKIKSFLRLQGRYIIDHQLEILKKIFSEIMVITNEPENFSGYNELLKYPDIHPVKGPLSGIHSALYHLQSDSLFVVAGDMPFLSKDLIKKLIDFSYQKMAVIPVNEKGIEPLHGIYHKSLGRPLDLFLKSSDKFSIREFLKTTDPSYFEVPVKYHSFININSPEDLKKYEKE